MSKDNIEKLMRIYDAILKDFENWDGKESIEDFMSGILKKRLLISKEEADKLVKEMIEGVLAFREAEKLIEENPELYKKVESKIDNDTVESVTEEFIQMFDSMKKEAEND